MDRPHLRGVVAIMDNSPSEEPTSKPLLFSVKATLRPGTRLLKVHGSWHPTFEAAVEGFHEAFRSQHLPVTTVYLPHVVQESPEGDQREGVRLFNTRKDLEDELYDQLVAKGLTIDTNAPPGFRL